MKETAQIIINDSQYFKSQVCKLKDYLAIKRISQDELSQVLVIAKSLPLDISGDDLLKAGKNYRLIKGHFCPG